MAHNQGIQEFYSVAQDSGFVRDFQLRITDWKVLNDTGGLGEDDYLMLRTATLPNMQTTINQVPFMGLDFNLPGTTKFPGSQAWNVEFYFQQQNLASGQIGGSLRDIFISTMLGNFDFQETSTGNLQLPSRETNYIEMCIVDDNLEPLTNYRLEGAFITQIGDVTFDLTAGGAVQKIPVTIAYQYWTSFSDHND